MFSLFEHKRNSLNISDVRCLSSISRKHIISDTSYFYSVIIQWEIIFLHNLCGIGQRKTWFHKSWTTRNFSLVRNFTSFKKNYHFLEGSQKHWVYKTIPCQMLFTLKKSKPVFSINSYATLSGKSQTMPEFWLMKK